jgi:hypothetical protein
VSLRPSMQLLPLKALYTVGELASAAGVERRSLRLLLEQAGCELIASGNAYYVSLADLELKVRPLWEGIKAAQALAKELS